MQRRQERRTRAHRREGVHLGLLGILLGVAVTGAAAGCGTEPAPPPAAKPAPAAPAKPAFVAGATAGDVAASVLAARQAHPDSKLVVYVGADWCEPCQAFHKSVEAGELDEPLRGVTFVEFDADRDREAIVAAGYDGRLIPRFALPGSDGRFGGEKIEGGIKGAGAVQHIMKRLAPLLSKA